jgi:hypothetical protein
MFIQERVTKVSDRAEAIRVFNYPYPALEEALVNAVYHRSYELREPIEVRIHRDRIEIASYPGPDASIRLQALKSKHFIARRYRNRRIGEFLKALDLTEGRGTGIGKIHAAMKANGSNLSTPDRTSAVKCNGSCLLICRLKLSLMFARELMLCTVNFRSRNSGNGPVTRSVDHENLRKPRLATRADYSHPKNLHSCFDAKE